MRKLESLRKTFVLPMDLRGALGERVADQVAAPVLSRVRAFVRWMPPYHAEQRDALRQDCWLGQ